MMSTPTNLFALRGVIFLSAITFFITPSLAQKGKKAKNNKEKQEVVIKQETDTLVSKDGFSVKVPAAAFAPVTNFELKIDLAPVSDFKEMTSAGLRATDTSGNLLSSAGMLCVTIMAGTEPVKASRADKDLVVTIPFSENDVNMRPYLWITKLSAWQRAYYNINYVTAPAPHYEIKVPVSAVKDGKFCISAAKRTNFISDNISGKDCGCANPFAYRKFPRDYDSTVKILNGGTIVKFDPGSFAPGSIKNAVVKIQTYATTTELLKDSVSSRSASGGYFPVESITHISFSTRMGKKLALRQGHKATVYEHIKDTFYKAADGANLLEANDTAMMSWIGSRDTTGMVKWETNPLSHISVYDAGCRYLVYDLDKEAFISHADTFTAPVLKKSKTPIEDGLYHLSLKGNVSYYKAYLVYMNSKTVEPLKIGSDRTFTVRASDKPSQIRLVMIGGNDIERYVMNAPISRLKYRKSANEFVVRKSDFKSVKAGKDPFDMLK